MKKPNVIVITTHDTGRFFGCYGVPTVHSPNIDGLAAEGVKLTNMFATSSVCSPSRGSLMTGQYPQRHGLMGLSGGAWNWKLTDPKRHLSHHLRNSGYRTAMFGHHDDEGEREGLGFDHYEVYMPSRHRTENYGAITIAEAFAAHIKRDGKQDKPFYAQIGFMETHTPYDWFETPPDDSAGVWAPSWTDMDLEDPETHAHLAGLQGAVRRADKAVGIILEALAETGQEEDTIVLFNVDHGPELPRAKWTMLDGGLGIGFIVRWPGGPVARGAECDAMLSNVDWVPTLCDLIGVPYPDHYLDGKSFSGLLKENAPASASPRESLGAVWVHENLWCMRTERYKLIRDFREGFLPGTRIEKPYVELYDLQNDPEERTNVSGDPAYVEALSEMEGRFWSWLEDVGDPLLKGPVPTPRYTRMMEPYREYSRWVNSDDN
jgi:arylsulfatase A-like enzyme